MLYAALQNGVDAKDRVQHAGPLRCRIHPPHLHPCYKAEAERGCPGHGRLHGASHVKRKGTKKCKCVTKKHPKSKDFRCFLELLGGFEPPISSLPTDWEDRVCCFQTLLHPLRSGGPSFPELLCPLSPSARFPVWVSVWVKGRREPAIAPPAQPDCYQSASPHRLRERLRTSPLSSNSVLRTPSAALALQ